MSRRCPDCDVVMGEVDFQMSNAYHPNVKLPERSEGILGSLGVKERRDVSAFMCPECGLVRFYADVE
ncbi:hypothetical protein OB920_01690 [Halobacteria archaeon HArc-gm2]|nr:hypothetical protein [Halobacteria archaeon HArc-gm2]